MKVHQTLSRLAQGLRTSLLLCLFWLGVSAALQAQVAVQRLNPNRNVVAANDDVINLNTQVVSLSVTVTDKQGRHLPNLGQRAFTVYEDQVAQEVSYFNQVDTPASIAIVFDLSGSMREDKITRARTALDRFLQNCHPEDEYSLIGFNNHAWVAVDRTRDSQQVLRQFNNVEPAGNTALYDAVALGLAQLERGQHPRRVLLLISDGQDNRSRASFRQIKRLAQESAALVYTVGITDFALRNQHGENVLQDLAGLSGGKAFFPKNAQAMSEAFEAIALELRQQYSLGYTPTNFVADGKWRKLKVVVSAPEPNNGIVIRARVGYYAHPPKRLGKSETVKAEN